jgi:integration host factor subunit beta
MPHLTRFDLITRLAKKRSLHPRKAELAVTSIINTMKSSLRDQRRIEIRRFGSFYIQKYDPKVARNPKTNESVHMPTKYASKFKPGQPLTERVNSKNQY